MKQLLIAAVLLPAMLTLPASAESLKELKQKTIGFMAQTICSTKRYDYDRDQVAKKIDYFAQIKGERVYAILKDPRIMQAANLMSMAMSKNCTSFNERSEYLKKAYDYMDANGL